MHANEVEQSHLLYWAKSLAADERSSQEYYLEWHTIVLESGIQELTRSARAGDAYQLNEIRLALETDVVGEFFRHAVRGARGTRLEEVGERIYLHTLGLVYGALAFCELDTHGDWWPYVVKAASLFDRHPQNDPPRPQNPSHYEDVCRAIVGHDGQPSAGAAALLLWLDHIAEVLPASPTISRFLAVEGGLGKIISVAIWPGPAWCYRAFHHPVAGWGIPVDKDFELATSGAWEVAAQNTPAGICTSVAWHTGDHTSDLVLSGDSHGAPMAAVMISARSGQSLDPRFVASIALNPNREDELSPVGHAKGKAEAALKLLDQMGRPVIQRVGFHSENESDARVGATAANRDPSTCIVSIRTFSQFLEEAFGEADIMRRVAVTTLSTLLNQPLDSSFRDIKEAGRNYLQGWVPISVQISLATAVSESGERSRQQSLWSDARFLTRHWVVEGASGSGKSELLRVQAIELALAYLDSLYDLSVSVSSSQLYYFVRANELEAATATNLVELASQLIGEKLDLVRHRKSLASLLETGEIGLCIDSLDGVDSAMASSLMSLVTEAKEKFPNLATIVSVRIGTEAHMVALESDPQIATVVPFSRDQFMHFARVLAARNRVPFEVFEKLSTSWETSNIRTPLAMQLLAITARHNTNFLMSTDFRLTQGSVYDSYVETLLRRWQSQRPCPPLSVVNSLRGFAQDLCLQVLRVSGSEVIDESTMLTLSRPLAFQYEAMFHRDLLRDLVGASILKLEGSQSPNYAFMHSTVMEYLAAKSMALRLDTIAGKEQGKFLAPYIGIPQFEGVWPHLAGLLKDPLPFLEFLVEACEKSKTWTLISTAVRSVREAKASIQS